MCTRSLLPIDDVPRPPTAFLSFAERDEIVLDTRKVRMAASRRRFRAIELPVLADSVEKLSDRDRRKNPTALKSLKFPRAEGGAAFDDLRAQIRPVRHASRFPRILGHISIQLKNRFDPGMAFFNRIGRLPPDACPGTGHSAGVGANRGILTGRQLIVR